MFWMKLWICWPTGYEAAMPSRVSWSVDANTCPSQTLDARNPALTMILDSISEVRLDTFNSISFNNPAFIKLWFRQQLSPFLPFVSSNFLSCLIRKGLNCSAYQDMWAQSVLREDFWFVTLSVIPWYWVQCDPSVQIFSSLKEKMSPARQMSVYTYFIKVYLTRINTSGRFQHLLEIYFTLIYWFAMFTVECKFQWRDLNFFGGLMYFRLPTVLFFVFIPVDPGCISQSSNSGDWLQKNLGAFSALMSFQEMQLYHVNFSVVLAVGSSFYLRWSFLFSVVVLNV